MSSSPLIKKEDPRITRTRNLIVNSFVELLPIKGFQSITVQNITEMASINRVTFYDHFPDKYALLDFTIQQMFRKELEKRTLNALQYSEDNLRTLIVMVCDFVSTARSHCATTTSEPQFEILVEKQAKKQLQELLEFWLKQVGSDIDPNIATTATSWAIYGLAVQWDGDKSKKKISAEQFADQILPMILTNLGEKHKVDFNV